MKNKFSPDEIPPPGRGDERGPRRGGGRRERMERGMLRLIVLDGLHSGAGHGYEVMKWVEQKTDGAYSPSPGILYPTLQLLEDEGAIQAEAAGERRRFTLTSAGQEELQQHQEKLQTFWKRFSEGVPAPHQRHDVRFLEEDLEAFNRTVWCGVREALEREDTDLIKQLRRLLVQWREEARETIAAAGSRGEAP